MKTFFTKIITSMLAIFIMMALNVQAETIVSAQDGDWNAETTWFGGIVPTPADSVVVQNLVDIFTGDSCLHLYVAPSGTIQNHINGSRTLVVLGNLYVDGTATYTNNNFTFEVGGNVNHNGIWDSPNILFTGSGEQIVSAAAGKVFEATQSGIKFEDLVPGSPLKFATDLTFIDIELIINTATLEFAPGIEVAVYEEQIKEANIIGNHSSLLLRDGAFIEYSNLDNLTLKGLFNIGSDNTASGDLFVTDTLQNLINSSRTLEVFGTFTNNGMIRETNNQFDLIFHGDVNNSGVWESSNVYFDGVVDQHINFDQGTYIFCENIEDRHLDSKIILDADWEIRDAWLNMNFATMEASGHKLTLRENARLEDAFVDEAVLGGVFTCYLNCVFTGTTTINDTLQNYSYSGYPEVVFEGNLIHNGVIRRSNSYALNLMLHGDFEINGAVDIETLTFASSNDQTLNGNAKGNTMYVDQVLDTEAASAIIINSDFTFIGSDWDLDGATINLNGGALVMQGGKLRNGALTANNQYLHQSGGAAIYNIHFSNVELRGVCQLYDDNSRCTNVTVTDTLRNHPNFNHHPILSTYGTFTNNGTINRSDAYGIRLFVNGDFINNGPIDMEDLVFAGVNDQTIYSTSKGGLIDVDQVNDTVMESAIIFNSDMTFYGAKWDLDSATINLNNGSLIMQGGSLEHGFLTTNNKYLRQSANAKISEMHFTNVELKGECLLFSDENYFTNVTVTDTLMNHQLYNHFPVLFVDGDFVNNGLITNSDAYRIDLRVEDNFYNNGKANFYQLVFTGDDIQHFTSPNFPITDSDIESTKTGGLVQCDDEILLDGCTVDFSWDVFSLQNGDLTVTGGILQDIAIEGNGFKIISEGNGGTANVAFENLSIEGHLYLGGNNILFDEVTLTGTISQRGSYNHDTHISTTGNFINNGHIIDNDTYKLWFYVQDVVKNNGEWISEKLIFDGDDMHYIESLGAKPFEVDDITISAKGGEVSITNELFLLNTDVNLSDQNLHIPDNGMLDLDNSSIESALVYGGDFSSINCSNNTWLNLSTFNNIILNGAVDTRVNTFVDCVLEAAMQNDNSGYDATIEFGGEFTNKGSIINRPSYSYELYSNVLGHVYNYGDWEIEKSNWQGWADQDIYLMDGSEINTPSDFKAMLGTGDFQWYKNDEIIDGETSNALDFNAITAAERGFYQCTTNEGSSRIIRICTPFEISLAAESRFCQYEAVMLEPEVFAGTEPYTYAWYPTEGLSDPNIQNPLANPETPTLYTLIVTDAVGCISESNVYVEQFPQLYANAGADIEICVGQATNLYGIASGGQANYTYSWSPTTGLNNPNIAQPIASPNTTTLYTLTVTDANGCVETSSVNVTVNPLPQAFGLSQDSTHFCYEQDTIICWLLDTEVGVNYKLLVNGSPNPGAEVFEGTGEAIPIWATTTVQGHYTLKGVNTSTGCEKMMLGSVMIFIDFLPEVIDQSGDEILIVGESTNLWVEVTSTQPPWSQWYKDDVLIPGAGDYNLLLDNVSTDATGTYQCLVTNNCDIAWSDPVSITVLERQIVEIPAGWSGFSTYQEVFDADVNNMFDQLIGNLVIVSDFENVFWPGAALNTYGNWNTKVGAQIKLEESATMNVDGFYSEDRTLNLGAGWHYLPVLGNCGFEASAIFDQAGASLELAKDIAGTRVYWPAFNIQTLNILEAGKAYLIKLNSASTITFPDCLKGDYLTPPSNRADNGSPWADPAYTGTSHLIVIPELLCNSILQSGDWIGVFDQNGVCAGLSEFLGRNIIVTAFADDPTTFENDGLVESDPLKLKAYRENTGQYLELNANYSTDYDDGYYASNGLSVVDNLKATNIQNDTGVSEVTIYPNPAYDVINIKGLQSIASWEIINAGGEVVGTGIANGNGQIPRGNLSSGLYTLKLVLNNKVICRKVMLY